MINEHNKNTWCVNAEHSLSVGNDGGAKICCMIEHDLTNEGVPFNVAKNSLDEIFNCSTASKIRTSLREGIRHEQCRKCWEEEDAGRSSKRLRDNQDSYRKFNGSGLKILEMNLGTTCNIKCRTCSPWSSSQWIREWYEQKVKASGKSWEVYLKEQTKFGSSYDAESLFWDSVHTVLPNLELMDFYGGEPFLSKKQWELIKTSAEKGYSKNQKLHYNTNCTIWPEEHLDYLNQFKLLDIAFSIDGVGERGEYVRYPAQWDVVQQNVDRWLQWAANKPNVQLNVCYTISPLNVYYMNEMIEWVEQKKKEYGEHKFGLYLNLVHYPVYYNIQFIPDYYKKAVTEKHKSLLNTNQYLEGIIQFMNNGVYNENHWKDFIKHTKMSDDFRKQDFKKVFPEVFSIMEENDVLSMEL